MPDRILLISPHPDDIAWSLGVTVARLHAAGALMSCLTLFGRTRYAPNSPEHGTLAASALRAREEDAWATLTGVRVERCDLPDASLRGFDDDTEMGPEPESEIVHRVTAVLRSAVAGAQPDLVVAPLALGGHVDHSATRRALRALDLAVDVLCYEDLPYAADAQPARAAHVEVVAIGPHWPAKEAGVRCFASQLPDQVLPVLRRHADTVRGERLFADAPAAGHRLRHLLELEAAQRRMS
jgi:LmbE family N-acetylglucosaminyl deacetylase